MFTLTFAILFLLLNSSLTSLTRAEQQNENDFVVDEEANKSLPYLKKTPSLKKQENLYQDFFKLTQENLTDVVEGSEKIWLIVFHDGFLDVEVKREAVFLRGVVRFAMVNRLEEKKLLKSLELNPKINYRVYVSGYFQDFRKFKDAIQFAKESVFNNLNEFEMNNWKTLLEEAYFSIPSRFPGVLLLEPNEFSYANLALRAVAGQMKNYYHFRTVSNATNETVSELLKQFTQERNIGVPGLFVIIAENNPEKSESDQNLSFYALRYDIGAHGPINYPKLLSFLLGINSEFRKSLPGESFSEDKDVVGALDVIKQESDFFQINEKMDENNKQNGKKELEEHYKSEL